MSDQHCFCCGQSDVPTYTCSSTVGPISLQYCDECLAKGAEPHSLYDLLGDKVEYFSDSALEMITFHEGEYKTVREYLEREV